MGGKGWGWGLAPVKAQDFKVQVCAGCPRLYHSQEEIRQGSGHPGEAILVSLQWAWLCEVPGAFLSLLPLVTLMGHLDHAEGRVEGWKNELCVRDG